MKGVEDSERVGVMASNALGNIYTAVPVERRTRRMAGLLCFTAVALCQQRATVAVDNDDTGGVVTGPKGPDAGVWVIAETSPYARARRAHRLLHAMVGLARFCNGFRRGALRP